MKESETLELKRSTSELKEAVISIVAILNKHQKGELYFGIRNNGHIIGQNITEKTIRDISKSISDNIEPKIFPKIIEKQIEGKDCIHIEFSGKECLYYAFGRACMRVGDEDKKLSAKELENMILNKNKDKLKWDNKICDNAKINDISAAKLKVFLKNAGLKYISIDNSLDKLGLIKNGKLLNTSILLFGKEPSTFFPNARLRCAVFGTKDTSFTISMQDYSGDLFYLIEKAERFILENIHIGMKLDGLYRIDVPEINQNAFREAVINAFCHRDYYEYDSVNIAIFKDRLEVRSAGGLYGKLTIEQIKKEMVSKRRNELIAEMLHKVHFVEKWGRGIRLILSKEPTADFKEISEMFITTFKRKSYVGKDVGKDVGKKLSKEERQKMIIEKIKNNMSLTYISLAHELRVNEKTIERDLQELKKLERIRFVGNKRTGYWEIIKNQIEP